MFLHVSVILFTGGGGAIPACIAGGIPACLAAGLQGGAWSRGGVCSRGGLLWRGGGCSWGEGPARLLLRAVRILLECILVRLLFPLPWLKVNSAIETYIIKWYDQLFACIIPRHLFWHPTHFFWVPNWLSILGLSGKTGWGMIWTTVNISAFYAAKLRLRARSHWVIEIAEISSVIGVNGAISF